MRCPFCDNELEPATQVCNACGAPVEEARAVTFEPGRSPSPPIENEIPQPVLIPPANAGYTPPAPVPPVYSSAASPSEGNVLGMPASQSGMISIVLGVLGMALSCIGCGGLLSLLGLAAGFLSLKTSSRQTGIIGMVLSGIGLVLTLAMLCLFLFSFTMARRNG